MCILANEGDPKSKSSRKETSLKIQKYKEIHVSGKNVEKKFSAPTPTPQSCSVELPHFPSSAVYGLVGGLTSSKNITLCGGASHDGTTFKECFTTDLDRRGWSQYPSLLESRAFSSCNPGLTPGSLVILGGRSGQATLDTSEVWQPSSRKWESGPNLPRPVEQHCTVKINSTHLLITGGLGSIEPIHRYKI